MTHHTQSLTRSEAERQIAELQRHIASLPTDNHPAEYEKGQLFERLGQIYMVVSTGEEGSNELDLRVVVGRHGVAWMKNKFFDGDEDGFTYLGHARDLLTIKPSAYVVTDDMVARAMHAWHMHDASPEKSWRHVIQLIVSNQL